MFSEPINYVTSVFRSFLGSNAHNDGDNHELENQSSDRALSHRTDSPPRTCPTRHNHAYSFDSGRDLQELDASRLRETTFTISEEDDEQTRADIREMLAEITSRETGYSSDSDSFEDISINGEHVNYGAHGHCWTVGDNAAERNSAAERNVLTADEIQIEYDKSRDHSNQETGQMPENHGYERHTINKRNNGFNSHQNSKTLTKRTRAVKFEEPYSDGNRQAHDTSEIRERRLRSGRTNNGFMQDEPATIEHEESDIFQPLPNISSVSESIMNRSQTRYGHTSPANEYTDSTSTENAVGTAHVQQKTRWSTLSENKSMFRSETTSVLKTNPVVAARLTQSYHRAKERIASKKPSLFGTVRNVYLHGLAAKMNRFIGHNAENSSGIKKYYMHDSSSDEDIGPRDPYSPTSRRKKWYEKKAKTGTQRLMRSKFFGKMNIYI